MTSLSQRPLRSGSWAWEARGASRASGDGDPWPRAFPRRSLSGTPHACRPDPVIKADGRAPCPAFSVTIPGHEPSAVVPVAHVTSSLLGAAFAASDSGSRGCRCSVVSFPSSRKPDRIYLLRFVNLAQIPSLCHSVSLFLSPSDGYVPPSVPSALESNHSFTFVWSSSQERSLLICLCALGSV